MALWIDPKGNEYVGDNTGHWLKAYVDYEDRRLHKKIDDTTAELESAIAAEENARKEADEALQDAIDAEEAERKREDSAIRGELAAHTGRTDNPHGVTKAQVGLGNVDNTSDVDKPVSNAVQAALDEVQNCIDTHKSDKNNPHGVTKTQVGLENVDNTSDMDKPVSTAVQAALDAEKTARETADGALQDCIDTHKADKQNPHGVTKAQVGLGNVDNTADADKPISGAVQTALNGKASLSEVLSKTNTAEYTPAGDYHPATKKYVDDVAKNFIGEATMLGGAYAGPETMAADLPPLGVLFVTEEQAEVEAVAYNNLVFSETAPENAENWAQLESKLGRGAVMFENGRLTVSKAEPENSTFWNEIK